MRLRLLIDVTATDEHVAALQEVLDTQPEVRVSGLLGFEWPGLFVGAQPAIHGSEVES